MKTPDATPDAPNQLTDPKAELFRFYVRRSYKHAPASLLAIFAKTEEDAILFLKKAARKKSRKIKNHLIYYKSEKPHVTITLQEWTRENRKADKELAEHLKVAEA